MAELNVAVDVSKIFNWNVKELFLYLVAEYSTPSTPVNQVRWTHVQNNALNIISALVYREISQLFFKGLFLFKSKILDDYDRWESIYQFTLFIKRGLFNYDA